MRLPVSATATSAPVRPISAAAMGGTGALVADLTGRHRIERDPRAAERPTPVRSERVRMPAAHALRTPLASESRDHPRHRGVSVHPMEDTAHALELGPEARQRLAPPLAQFSPDDRR